MNIGVRIYFKILKRMIRMWAFMTTGTQDFLEKLMERHPSIRHYFMKDGANTLVYYEDTKKKSIFVSGRRFEILYKKADIWNLGFIAMEHIPVDKQSAQLFESRFEEHFSILNDLGELLSARLLKDRKRGLYV